VATAGVSPIGGRLTGRLRAVLHLDDSPSRIALALAVGVFISCTPFYGLQTLLSLGIATLFRLNKVATITGTWLNLPWFAPFIYAGAVKLGAWLLPDLSGLAGVSAWLLIGTTALGFAAAVLTWIIAFGVIRARRVAVRPSSLVDREAAVAVTRIHRAVRGRLALPMNDVSCRQIRPPSPCARNRFVTDRELLHHSGTAPSLPDVMGAVIASRLY